MRQVMDLVRKVAKLDDDRAGAGRERHRQGDARAAAARRVAERATAPFIPVNLAAVPSELVESTLFGHEKGAFTGAVRQQLGKFEMAAGGTLFLDEIGDLRLDLQAKLLRAIQEGEIERVGGTKPISTDFRLVVATHVDLERAVREGRFREDLYYRINVIPIRMPPLRERLEDLPTLDRLLHRTATTPASTRSVMGVTRRGARRAAAATGGRATSASCRTWSSGWSRPTSAASSPKRTCRSSCSSSRLKAKSPSSEGRFADAVGAFERNLIVRALQECDGTSRRPSRYLGVPHTHAQAQDAAARHPRAGADRPRRRPAAAAGRLIRLTRMSGKGLLIGWLAWSASLFANAQGTERWEVADAETGVRSPWTDDTTCRRFASTSLVRPSPIRASWSCSRARHGA